MKSVKDASIEIEPHVIEVVRERFDSAFYAEEYPDIRIPHAQLFSHFVTVGCHEGRSPNPHFDVSEYLAANLDVLRSGMNPVYHYYRHGKGEGRRVVPTIRIKQRLALFIDADIGAWDTLLTPLVNVDFYKEQLKELQPTLKNLQFNAAMHYGLLGWKLGVNPSPTFDTKSWQKKSPPAEFYRINPLLARLLLPENFLADAGSGLSPEDTTSSAEVKSGDAGPSRINENVREDSQPPKAEARIDLQYEGLEENAVKLGVFDARYYLSTYSDVREAGVDPFYHYMNAGWRENRNPAPSFDTTYYLKAYAHLFDEGANPLTHFLIEGAKRGLQTKPPGGWRVDIFRRATAPEQREIDMQPYRSKSVSPDKLWALVESSKTKKLILALSHDSYTAVTGGTQLFIADEAMHAKRHGYTHLHLTPLKPGLTVGLRKGPQEVLVTLNGKIVGATDGEALIERACKQKSLQFFLSIHSLMGFGSKMLKAMAMLGKKNPTYMWLHDYSLLCNGYNLLRNDVSFCGAPNASSTSCQACVYGVERANRIETINKWIRMTNAVVVSPSEAALRVWISNRSGLIPPQEAVVPHWLLDKGLKRRRSAKAKVRMAFIGYPSANKGWPLFNDLMNVLAVKTSFQFLHFVKGGLSPSPATTPIDCAVSPADRFATTEKLKKNKVDVVAILSPWPETFSYVAAEALAAGCVIVCLASSGNVRAFVNSTAQGVIYESESELLNAAANEEFENSIRNALAEACYFSIRPREGIFELLNCPNAEH